MTTKFPKTVLDTTSYKSTVRFGHVILCGEQAFDGFLVTIKDNEDFEGSYEFTYAYDEDEALEAIFSGEAEAI